MRIVHLVCSDAFAGVERYVCALAGLQAERGAEVTVLGGDPARMTAALAPDVRFAPAPDRRSGLRALRAARTADVLNTHMSDADAVGIAFRPTAPRVKLVSTRHFASPRGASWPVRAGFALAGHAVHANIAISGFVAASIGEPSETVLTGVRDAAGPDGPRRRTVLMANRLESEKSTRVGLEAWTLSGLSREGWRLEIAGEGAEEDLLREHAHLLGITRDVDFLGYRSDVAALMSTASIFLATAPAEPLGLSVIEAMAHALPVVAADAGGHRESAGSVTSAALFAPGDTTGAAAQLRRLAGDNEARDAYGLSLQRFQRDRLGVQRWVDGIHAVYERVLKGRA